VDGATFYHATNVDPEWRNVEYIVTIEDHIFYR
jgi:spore germination cell wall hydrolase CwlJ-like protein